MAALAIAGAAFVFIRAGFGDEQRTTVGPDPGSVCPSKSHLDPAYVDLNGTEVSSDVLAKPGVSRDQLTLLPASVVDEFFTNPEAQLSDAPTEGWRPILEDQEHGRVVIAAPMPDGKTWYYVNFVKDGGEWSLAGWGANVPYATPAQRGEGMRLDWRGDVLYDPRSSGLGIWLVNDRSENWVDDRGEYFAIVHLFDPTTGEEIRQGPGGIDGTGRAYRVPAGGSVELPLVFGDMSSVPAGTYPAVACVPDLALESPVGTVTVVVPSTPSANGTAGSTVVPDLIGLKDQEALNSLNDLKLKWDVALREVPGADPWRVTSSDPIPGTPVEPGSTVPDRDRHDDHATSRRSCRCLGLSRRGSRRVRRTSDPGPPRGARLHLGEHLGHRSRRQAGSGDFCGRRVGRHLACRP